MQTINAYLRVSGRKQIDGHGFSRQLDAIKRYCRKNQLKIDKVFKEQVSGTKDESERKEFSAMVSDMLANG